MKPSTRKWIKKAESDYQAVILAPPSAPSSSNRKPTYAASAPVFPRPRLDAPRRRAHPARMSTLAEIEQAADTLPAEEQETLLRHLEGKLRARTTAVARLVVENGQPVLVAPPGAPAMTPEVVKAALADFP